MTTYGTPEPVVLDGFQAILKPGDWGYKLSALLPKSIVSKLEEERESALDWARSKAKNPKRVTVKPEPWEELENNPGTYQVRFSWKDKDKLFPAIVDTEGTLITDTVHLLMPFGIVGKFGYHLLAKHLNNALFSHRKKVVFDYFQNH